MVCTISSRRASPSGFNSLYPRRSSCGPDGHSFQRAWASVVHRSLNMFSLIALGTGSAYLYSLFATFTPGMFPAGFHGMGGTVAVYFEAAAVITVLCCWPGAGTARPRADRRRDPRLAEIGSQNGAPLEGRRRRTRKWRLSWFRSATVFAFGPATACRSMAKCSRARGPWTSPWSPASRCPPPSKSGDKLIGGTVNGTGSLVMRADKVGADTMLARIVAMVSEAQRSRAPNSAHGGHGVRLFCSGGAGHGCPRLHRVGRLGSCSRAFLCADRGGLRPHHRLSLRAWPRHPDVDRRGDRQGRGRWRPDQVG